MRCTHSAGRAASPVGVYAVARGGGAVRVIPRAVGAVALAVVLVGLSGAGAAAEPIHGVNVNMGGAGTGYAASLTGTVTALTSPIGSPLTVALADVSWDVTSGGTSLGATCIAGFVTRLEYDAATGRVGFDCFALGHAIEVSGSPPDTVVVGQAYLLGNVHVTAVVGSGATVEGYASPFPIGFPNRPGGWATLWSLQQVVCVGGQPCELAVSP